MVYSLVLMLLMGFFLFLGEILFPGMMPWSSY